MTTKHTPGPWEFRVYSDGCTIVSKHDAPGRSVRDWLKGVSVKVDVEINDDQSNASMASPDARLIAAAPDLLTALQAVQPYFEGEHHPDHPHCVQLRAAIAKATQP